MPVKSKLGAHCSSHGYPGLRLRSSSVSKLKEFRCAVCAVAYVVTVAIRVPNGHILGTAPLTASYRDGDVRRGTFCPR